jgi:hypothetical protein
MLRICLEMNGVKHYANSYKSIRHPKVVQVQHELQSRSTVYALARDRDVETINLFTAQPVGLGKLTFRMFKRI